MIFTKLHIFYENETNHANLIWTKTHRKELQTKLRETS